MNLNDFYLDLSVTKQSCKQSRHISGRSACMKNLLVLLLRQLIEVSKSMMIWDHQMLRDFKAVCRLYHVAGAKWYRQNSLHVAPKKWLRFVSTFGLLLPMGLAMQAWRYCIKPISLTWDLDCLACWILPFASYLYCLKRISIHSVDSDAQKILSLQRDVNCILILFINRHDFTLTSCTFAVYTLDCSDSSLNCAADIACSRILQAGIASYTLAVVSFGLETPGQNQ